MGVVKKDVLVKGKQYVLEFEEKLSSFEEEYYDARESCVASVRKAVSGAYYTNSEKQKIRGWVSDLLEKSFDANLQYEEYLLSMVERYFDETNRAKSAMMLANKFAKELDSFEARLDEAVAGLGRLESALRSPWEVGQRVRDRERLDLLFSTSVQKDVVKYAGRAKYFQFRHYTSCLFGVVSMVLQMANSIVGIKDYARWIGAIFALNVLGSGLQKSDLFLVRVLSGLFTSQSSYIQENKDPKYASGAHSVIDALTRIKKNLNQFFFEMEAELL
jgi:hypothetical protein